jgi:hypothetical protein
MPSSLVIVIKKKAKCILPPRHVVDLRSTQKLPLQHFFFLRSTVTVQHSRTTAQEAFTISEIPRSAMCALGYYWW